MRYECAAEDVFVADGVEDWGIVLVAEGRALEVAVGVGTTAANIKLSSGDVQLLFGLINVAAPFSLIGLIWC